VSFNCIVWGNRSTRGKPSTCHKLLAQSIIYSCIEYTWPWAGFERIVLEVICTDCTCSWNEILIARLIFDFLNVIRKLRHIFYCDVGFVLWYVLFHTRRITLLVKYFTPYIGQEWPKVHCGRDHVVARFPTTSAISAYHL
jgi:hypothetical protein